MESNCEGLVNVKRWAILAMMILAGSNLPAHSAMPLAAIASQMADLVGPPHELAGRLAELVRNRRDRS